MPPSETTESQPTSVPQQPDILQGLEQPSFVPTVNGTGTKKLELQVSFIENPVIVRSNQPNTVVRGHVAVLSREVQKARTVVVQLHGTKLLANIQQMGSTSSGKTTLVKLEKALSTDSISSQSSTDTWAVGTYKLPFEFILSNNLPPTLHLPRCDVEYAVTAAFSKSSSSSYLKLLPHKSIKAQKEVTIVRYSGIGNDPSDFVARLKPVVKVGTLGSNKNGRGSLPYRISMDRNIAAPGDLVNFKLEIYPPGSTLNFNCREFAALAAIAEDANREQGEERDEYATDDENEQEEANHSSPQARSPLDGAATTAETISPNTNSGMSPEASDAPADGNDAHADALAHIPVSLPIDRPPTYASKRTSQSNDNGSWSALATAAMADNETDVVAYKVRAKFVQRVCYMTDHDLVADAADDVYLFWTKRVLTKEKVSNMLDLTSVINGKPLKLDWTMPIPSNIQYDTLTSDIQVRYDVFVDFFPRGHSAESSGKAIKDMVSRVNNECVSSRLPLRTIPVSISALLANPPSYAS
ncbi:hypothetical protein GGI12_002279 [Dipsacomyces acuminosporus]|nr:hypothetical protein GGI12_002279 [Dipsacomyces acuminosporus]